MASEYPVLCNGKILPQEQIHIAIDSAWAKFAPGFFETMKVANGKIYFWDEHYSRLKQGAKYWDVKVPAKSKLLNLISDLIIASELQFARVRLQFTLSFNGEEMHYTATIVPLENENYIWNEKGLQLQYYDKNLIAAQQATPFKSNNREIYLLAERSFNRNANTEVVLLNTQKEVTDTSRCSIFWIKNGVIYTPPVSSGGVDSTFCKFLFEQKKIWNLKLVRKATKMKDLESADEVFVANVIRGIQWVRSFRKKKYTHGLTRQLFDRVEQWEAELILKYS